VRAAAVLALPGALAATLVVSAGCDDGFHALLDSYPIALIRAPIGNGVAGDGALVAIASPPDRPDQSFQMLVSTGSPLTLLEGPLMVQPATEKTGFDLLDPTSVAAVPPDPHLRGSFRDVTVLRLPLQALGDNGSFVLGGLLGGDLMRAFSVDIRFGAACTTGLCSSMTFWGHLGPDLGFLQDSGYAVIRFALFGGGETTAKGNPDFLGQRGPLVLEPTRVVLRTCAVPDTFTPDLPRDRCCNQTDAASLARGIDLALMLDTGVGPLVLSDAAWDRVTAKLAADPVPTVPPDPTNGELLIATWPQPIRARWSTIPRFALVDLETGAVTDPGPCVELARARRIEQVSTQIVAEGEAASSVCTQPCDNDPRETGKAQNSAAYLELSGQIPVAIISNTDDYLQGLRFDVRPEGPELDGVIGAGALGRSRVEIDYLSRPSRAVFSCEPGALRAECWAAARCPRVPDASSEHRCFGLRPHRLAASCAPSGC
jgi:hypothetical protein